jgi:hypothetical protein
MVAPFAQPLPALGLPPEALRSLRSAFAREVAVRLPRLLRAVRVSDRNDGLELLRSDATALAEGCTLLGDAAAARALHRLGELLGRRTDDVEQERERREEAVSTAALLLGRWAEDQRQT